jgi:hypothetical protein
MADLSGREMADGLNGHLCRQGGTAAPADEGKFWGPSAVKALALLGLGCATLRVTTDGLQAARYGHPTDGHINRNML